MPTRPQGTKYAKLTDSALVMTGIGNLYSAFLSWRGLTAGDRVAILDGINGSGAVIEEVIINNANGDGLAIPLPAVGKEFGTGLYVAVAKAGGEIDLSLGYDANG